MKYWYDTEFIEDGKTIDLISIGMVAEDGREYYAQSVEFDPDKASQWVKDHVLTQLIACSDAPHGQMHGLYQHRHGQCSRGCPWRTREEVKQNILAFMNVDKYTYGKPELWGYYSAYDHVAFAQLFGTMMDLPPGYPMYTRDIKQWCDQLGNPPLPEQEKGEHHALLDARWNKISWEFLKGMEREVPV